MRTTIAVSLLGLLTTASSRAQDWRTNHVALGELIVSQFVSAPFPHPSRAEGHPYDGQFYSAEEHYHDSTVALFVPNHFQAGTNIDFVVHFHGWRASLPTVLEKFELVKQLAESKRNAVLVVPQGPLDAPDSFGGKLEDPDGFQRFMAEVMTTLAARREFQHKGIGRIILSGHSGGYHVISSILDHGGLTQNVKEVWLFDALYAQTEKFAHWQEQSEGRLIDIYTPNGGTREESEQWISALREKGGPFLATNEQTVTSQELKTNRLIFLFTPMGHNDVLAAHRTFREFLQTSCLSSIRETK